MLFCLVAQRHVQSGFGPGWHSGSARGLSVTELSLHEGDPLSASSSAPSFSCQVLQATWSIKHLNDDHSFMHAQRDPYSFIFPFVSSTLNKFVSKKVDQRLTHSTSAKKFCSCHPSHHSFIFYSYYILKTLIGSLLVIII